MRYTILLSSSSLHKIELSSNIDNNAVIIRSAMGLYIPRKIAWRREGRTGVALQSHASRLLGRTMARLYSHARTADGDIYRPRRPSIDHYVYSSSAQAAVAYRRNHPI